MAAFNSLSILALVMLALSAPLAVEAGDPDILTDFVVPAPGPSNAPFNITGGGEYFTLHGFRSAFNRSSALPHQSFNLTKATTAEFPALTFPPGSVNPTHAHAPSRAAELLLVVDGALSAGFVDTSNKLYTQDLAAGDMFVFPRGTVHWQCNKRRNAPAMALSAFGSAAPGRVSVPLTVFGTGIDDGILAKSFKTDVPTVQKLKAALTPAEMWHNLLTLDAF